MKRQWDIEELIEHFTLIQEDLDLLANKSGPTQPGFALLLKYFQIENVNLTPHSLTFRSKIGYTCGREKGTHQHDGRKESI